MQIASRKLTRDLTLVFIQITPFLVFVIFPCGDIFSLCIPSKLWISPWGRYKMKRPQQLKKLLRPVSTHKKGDFRYGQETPYKQHLSRSPDLRLRDSARLLGSPQWLTFVLCRVSALTVAVPFGICTRFSILRRALDGRATLKRFSLVFFSIAFAPGFVNLILRKPSKNAAIPRKKTHYNKKVVKNPCIPPGGVL